MSTKPCVHPAGQVDSLVIQSQIHQKRNEAGVSLTICIDEQDTRLLHHHQDAMGEVRCRCGFVHTALMISENKNV